MNKKIVLRGEGGCKQRLIAASLGKEKKNTDVVFFARFQKGLSQGHLMAYGTPEILEFLSS